MVAAATSRLTTSMARRISRALPEKVSGPKIGAAPNCVSEANHRTQA